MCLALPPAESWACQCYRKPPVFVELERSDVVFIGTVLTNVSAGPRMAHTTVTFDVQFPVKGVVERKASVGTSKFQGDCGAVFVVGEVYVVYADRLTTTGALWTTQCSRTALARDAQGDLEALRAPVCPASMAYDEASW